jgi:mannosyltransferase OCH1-like enzyme
MSIPVAQIFLKLKPDATITDFPVYVEGSNRFRNATSKYNLYNDKKADTLMKKYPEFYNMWKNVKYAIMKVDILRFVILYHYGGMVADLDVFPLKPLASVIPDKDKMCIWTPSRRFNYEVIYTPKHNPVCLDFIRYVKTQIEEKNKMKIYDTWKARYVFNTSGPNSFKRFLNKYHKRDEDILYENMETINEYEVSVLKPKLKRLPFVSLQQAGWFSSMGVKGNTDLSNLKKKREELLDLLRGS